MTVLFSDHHDSIFYQPFFDPVMEEQGEDVLGTYPIKSPEEVIIVQYSCYTYKFCIIALV